jgi:hypothetical protein
VKDVKPGGPDRDHHAGRRARPDLGRRLDRLPLDAPQLRGSRAEGRARRRHGRSRRAATSSRRSRGVVDKLRPKGTKPIVPPDSCPVCGEPVHQLEGRSRSAAPTRDAPRSSGSRSFITRQRKAMDIEGLGDERVVQLLEAGLLPDLTALYTLKKEQLIPLEKWGAKGREVPRRDRGLEARRARASHLRPRDPARRRAGRAKLLAERFGRSAPS